MREVRNVLIYLSIKYKGDWCKVMNHIEKKLEIDNDDMDKTLSSMKVNCMTIVDEDYPQTLKDGHKPPIVLFYKGDINLLKEIDSYKRISVIGTRKPSTYARLMGKIIVENLNKKYIIISGLAKGIDGIAHRAALNSEKKTIAVLGSPINTPYPSENKLLYDEIIHNGGLIISEYPPNGEIAPDNFLNRNRIIAMLCNVLFVVESSYRSGCNSTTFCALTENKDICCLPARANEGSNCNKLIKEGAYLVESAKDIEEIVQ